MNEQMQQVIDAVKNAAPAIWQAAYRQVWINGIEAIFWVLAFSYAFKLLLGWFKPVKAMRDEADRVICLLLLSVGLVTAVVLATLNASYALDDFLNPTFAAIKNLAELGKSK